MRFASWLSLLFFVWSLSSFTPWTPNPSSGSGLAAHGVLTEPPGNEDPVKDRVDQTAEPEVVTLPDEP